MKTGIIIIFHNNEKDINLSFFIKQLNRAKDIQFCLVNNASKDHTYKILEKIKETCAANVSIVDIKKFKSDVAAVRSGSRYMSNQFNLNSIGYITTNLINIKYNGLNSMIRAISENYKLITEYNTETLERRNIKLTLYKSLFSVVEYLKKIKVNNSFLKLQYLSKL